MNLAQWTQQYAPGFWPLALVTFLVLVLALHTARFIYETREQFLHPKTPGAVITDLGLVIGAGLLGIVLQKHPIQHSWYERLWWFAVLFIMGSILWGIMLFPRVGPDYGGWANLPVPEIVHWLGFAFTFAIYGFFGAIAVVTRQPTFAFVGVIILVILWGIGNLFDIFVFPKISL